MGKITVNGTVLALIMSFSFGVYVFFFLFFFFFFFSGEGPMGLTRLHSSFISPTSAMHVAALLHGATIFTCDSTSIVYTGLQRCKLDVTY